MAASDILRHFTNVRSSGEDQWSAQCPTHDDANGKSLSIGDLGDGRTLVHCHAGCSPHAVLSAVNLTMADLFPPRETHQSNGHAGERSKPKSTIVATYDYHDESGQLLYQVCRMEPKDFRQRAPNPNGGWRWKVGDVRRVLYRLPEIEKAKANATSPPTVIVCEGEKDVDAILPKLPAHITATTNPGGASKTKSNRSKWLPQYSDSLAGCHVAIIPDNDEAGRAHALAVAHSTHPKAASVKIIELPNLPPKGDLSDWLAVPTNTIDVLLSIIAATPTFDPVASPLPTDKPDPSATIIVEDADDPHRLAKLFAATHQLRYWRQEWYKFNGRCYQPIPFAELQARVNGFIKSEFDRLFADNPNADFVRKVNRGLVSNVIAAIESILFLADQVEIGSWIEDEHGDMHTRRDYISMANGIFDLNAFLARSNDYLLPHSPQWWSTISLPYAFDPTAQCPRWQQFLQTNLESDPERIAILQEWAGYLLLPTNGQQKFLALEGEGANGKSVYCAVTQALVGAANASNIPLESFSGRFELTETLGKLVNVAADCGEIDKAAEGKLKSFVSGDRMFFDRKGIPGINATPTARLMMAYNNRPRFSDRSGGLRRRMIPVPFRVQIAESDRVLGMDTISWWEASGELPGIFNWAIAGLYRLRQQGRFTKSAICEATLIDFMEEMNPARAFLSAHYEPADECQIPSTEIYAAYKTWCQECGYRPLSDGSFGKEIKRLFQNCGHEQKRIGGRRVWLYLGIGIRHDGEMESVKNLFDSEF